VGAPLAATIDHQTLEDNTVTVRMRDSMEQSRVDVAELDSVVAAHTSYP